MITKEKIIEILSNYSSYADSSLGNIIQEEKHDIIAEDIMSKLRQPPVSGRSEQFVCGANRVMGEKRCERQCGQCEELYPQTNCH